ncbi:MAG: alcohol dehydrogenase catalytic domain-containing protein [Candidatus Aminicenantes bacterium]
MEIRNIPAPDISSSKDVLLRVGMAGVCGSDVHYFRHGRSGGQDVEFPWIVGHECSAVVEKVGPHVTLVSLGDWVAVDPAVSCGECDQCLAGRPNTCRNLRFLGFPGQMQGCLCEFIVMPEENCYRIGESVNPSQGVLVEPLSIGIYALDFLKKMETGAIGILGCGPIGLSVMQAALARGIRKIYATEKIPGRLHFAQKKGAAWTGNPEEMDIVSEILRVTDGLDAVFECCGEQEALDQAIDLLKPGGTLLILGIPEIVHVSFDAHKLRRKEIRVQNVRRQRDCTQKAIDLIASKEVDIDFMATHIFSLEEAQEAFELVAEYGDGVIKAMLSFP